MISTGLTRILVPQKVPGKVCLDMVEESSIERTFERRESNLVLEYCVGDFNVQTGRTRSLMAA